MTIGRRAAVIPGGLRRLLDGRGLAADGERQLLDRFLADHDEAAFATLMARHGPMVLATCRAILADHADAEDASQATFLVLARRAGAVRPGEPLGPWLHGVARRVAMQARGSAARRRVREVPGPVAEPAALDDGLRAAERRELAALLHAEVDRLGPPERSAIVLCDLEGLTHQEAADRLGWPLGTVKSRVARGRERIRSRLVRRGMTLTGPALAAALAREASAATARAGLAAASVLTPVDLITAATLARGVIRTMMLAKIKAGAVTLAVASAAVVAAPALLARPQDPGPVPMPARPSLPAAPKPAPPPARPAPIAQAPGDEPPAEARSWAIRALLDERTPLHFDDKPLTDVFRSIQAATRGRDAHLPDGIPIFVDPQGFQDANCKPESTVTIDLKGVPLRVSLALLLRQRDLRYVVRDGLLTVTFLNDSPSRSGVEPNAADRPANRAIRIQLERRVPMRFTPYATLADVIRLVRESTRDAAAGLPDGIPVYVHPEDLQDAGKTLQSTIRIDRKGEPLRATLAEVLATLRMTYVVEGGLLHVVVEDQAR